MPDAGIIEPDETGNGARKAVLCPTTGATLHSHYPLGSRVAALVEIRIRVPPAIPPGPICLIGPGGAGKTTTGLELGALLKRRVVDLDRAFHGRIEHIGSYIRTNGYEKYVEENSTLAHKLTAEITGEEIFVFSSGFLATDVRSDTVGRNRALVRATGYSILLLPSGDVDRASEIVVQRQLGRGFGLEAGREERKFRARFPQYMQHGDMQVFSESAPSVIARAIAERLGL